MVMIGATAIRRTSSPQANPAHRRLVAVVAVWSALVSVGLLGMWHYGATPGEGAQPPASWPRVSQLERGDGHTLLLFAHPHCPCTHATLAELERLIADCREPLDTHVLFIAPQEVESDWHNTELVQKARSLSRVKVHIDDQRRESETFRVRTSGSCLVYGPRGKLLFTGGLTVARGHEGASDGTHAILALLEHGRADLDQTLVYGCPLFEPDRAAPSETHSPVEALD